MAEPHLTARIVGQEARDYHGRALALKAVNAVVPPLALIFVVLGNIFTGFATPTE